MRLGYLIISPNGCSCNVLTEAPEGVTVDLEGGKWRYEYAHHKQDELIGHGCYFDRTWSGMLIGVYDLDNTKQINSMVRDAVEAHNDRSDAD